MVKIVNFLNLLTFVLPPQFITNVLTDNGLLFIWVQGDQLLPIASGWLPTLNISKVF